MVDADTLSPDTTNSRKVVILAAAYLGKVRLIDNLAHQRQVFGIHDGIDGQIGLHTRFTACRYNSCHVGCREIDRTAGTHVKVLDTEIDARGTGLYSRSQTLPAPYRRHYFYVG